MTQPNTPSKYRALKDPHADITTVDEYEIRRRLAIDATPAPAASTPRSAAKTPKSAA